MTADNWLLDVKLRITGRGRIGADGMVKKNYYLIFNYKNQEIIELNF